MEVWKTISDWDRYEISDLGNIRSKTISGIDKKNRPRLRPGTTLKQYRNKVNGYLYVTLSKESFLKKYTVHRLVAAAFCITKFGGIQVNHIDGDKCNNAASNLEYVSASDNMKHAYRTGLNNITDYKKKSLITI